MAVEDDIANLRDDIREGREDIRSMRAVFDSFIKTFQGDVMSRLATLEQWKVSHAADDARVESAVSAMQLELRHSSSVPTLVAQVAELKAQNDRQEGSIKALKWVGSLLGGMLVLAEIVHTVIAISKGH